MLAGTPTPIGPARRGAKPPALQLTALDDPGLPEVLAELAAARADEMDADTVNRELSVARKAIGWWLRQGWITTDPTFASSAGPPRRTRPRRSPRPGRRRLAPGRRELAGQNPVADPLRERGPGATLKVYPGAPHGLSMVAAYKDEFNADLMAFARG